MDKTSNYTLSAFIAMAIILFSSVKVFGGLKWMSATSLREIPLSVPEAQLRFTSDGRQCPIVDFISDINFTIEADSIYVETITDGKKKGYKRVFFDNIPKDITVTAPGYDDREVRLVGDSFPSMEFGKQYELFILASEGGTPVKNHTTVKITVSPSDLKNLHVILDGEDSYVNKYQILQTRLRYGLHSYSVTADGYKPAGGRFWVTSRAPVNINVTLTSKKSNQHPVVDASPKGTLNVRVLPDGVGGDDPLPHGDDGDPDDPRDNPPFSPEEKIFYDPYVIERSIIGCLPPKPSDGVSGDDDYPIQEEYDGDVYVESFRPREIPVLMTPRVARWVKIDRIRYVGTETTAEAKKKRYSPRAMHKFQVTSTRLRPSTFLDNVHVYIVDADYKLYSIGCLYPTYEGVGVKRTLTWTMHHWGEYMGRASNGPSDFYTRKSGGVERYYDGPPQYDIPRKIRGFFLSESEWDAMQCLHMIEQYLSKKTVIW